MGRKKTKIPTEAANQNLADANPFAALDTTGLPRTSQPSRADAPDPAPGRKPGMRVEIRREKSGKGGKTVTTLRGLTTLDQRSFDRLLKDLKTSLGTGGTAVPGGIQLQGDCRDQVEEILSGKGFRPVRAGG